MGFTLLLLGPVVVVVEGSLSVSTVAAKRLGDLMIVADFVAVVVVVGNGRATKAHAHGVHSSMQEDDRKRRPLMVMLII